MSSRKKFIWWMSGAAVAVTVIAAAMVAAGRDGSTEISPSANGELASPTAMDRVTGEGFAVAVPAEWRIERTASDSLAVYDRDPSFAGATSTACKIEVSAFPFSSSDDESAWIAARIGADPSVAVVEESSGDIAVNGGTGVQWNGTIDGAPMTLVYAFSRDHAYEIAPSVIGSLSSADDGWGGNTQCDDALDAFVAQFSMQ